MGHMKSSETAYVGTVKKNNKRKLPLDFTNTRVRPGHSSLVGFQENKTIVSCTPKKYGNVILISNLQHDVLMQTRNHYL